MALASLDDINAHLPHDKLKVTEGNTQITLIQVDVERSIKGYLSSVFSAATLAAWADPDTTPEYIRGCAGRLVAAMYYAQRTAEEVPDWDKTYAQFLYNSAMEMLQDVRSGTVILSEVNETAGTQFGEGWFWPNSTTSEPKFTMDGVI